MNLVDADRAQLPSAAPSRTTRAADVRRAKLIPLLDDVELRDSIMRPSQSLARLEAWVLNRALKRNPTPLRGVLEQLQARGRTRRRAGLERATHLAQARHQTSTAGTPHGFRRSGLRGQGGWWLGGSTCSAANNFSRL